MPHVVVIGAGVIGLQSALTLLSQGHSVTILATHLPDDLSPSYTSPWAGAHWRTHASASDPRQQQWDTTTYSAWLDLISGATTLQQRNDLGLELLPSLSYWDVGTEPGERIWWAPVVRGFETLSTASAEVQRVTDGGTGKRVGAAARFEAVAVNVPVHLRWLRGQVLEKGGVFVRATVPVLTKEEGGSDFARSLREAARVVKRVTGREAGAWVNATGLGAGRLCGDGDCVPVKGQTVLVRGEADAIRTRFGEGSISYVIPRPGSGTTILGGTKEVGVDDSRVSEEVTERILAGARSLAPELLTGRNGEFEVISAQVGFRPGRDGGARVESEKVGDWKVVHAYGVDGAGYQNSIGLGQEVASLVQGLVGGEKARL
ncbi:FAD dependent oxidoreductase-like protein 6 [Elsinoe fawcettii]|nr:FAD dependent oxidoreductase-like protein 6 [Elsinoe fawcettii]